MEPTTVYLRTTQCLESDFECERPGRRGAEVTASRSRHSRFPRINPLPDRNQVATAKATPTEGGDLADYGCNLTTPHPTVTTRAQDDSGGRKEQGLLWSDLSPRIRRAAGQI